MSKSFHFLVRAIPLGCLLGAAPAQGIESIHFGYIDTEPAMTDSLRLSTRVGTLWWSANKQRYNAEDGSPIAYSYHDGYVESSFLINGITHTAAEAAARWRSIMSGNGDPWTGVSGAQIGTPSMIILDELVSSFTDGGDGTLLRNALQTYLTYPGASRNDIAAFLSPGFCQSTSIVLSNYDDLVYSANNYLRSIQLELYATEANFNSGGDTYLASQLGTPLRKWTTTFGVAPARVQPTLLVSNSADATGGNYPQFLNRQFQFMASGWYTSAHAADANVATALRNGVSSYSWTPGSGDYQLLNTETLRDAYFEEFLNWYSVLGNTTLDNFWNVDADGSWGTNSSWLTGTAVNGVDSLAKFIFRITQPRNISFTSAKTVGHLTIANENSYTFLGTAALSLQTTSGSADITVTSGSHIIACPVMLNSNITFAITPAASMLTLSGALTAAGRAINKTGAGTVLLNNVRASSLAVAGGTVRIVDNGGDAATSSLASAMFSGGGKLDLRNNNLVIVGGDVGAWNGSTYSGVTALIRDGRNDGAWNGSGIITSMPDARAMLTTFGVASAGDVGKTTFGGLSVSASDVLVMYTYAGDADLSGDINGDDYFRIDTGFVSRSSGYVNGDFDYSGRIDADDYFLIDRNYSRQDTAFTGAAPFAGVSVIPEPAGLMLIGIGLIDLRRRQRRR